MKSKIITLSGTSGAGKTYLGREIMRRFPCISEIAGITTRPKRIDEVEGQSSHFLTLDEFTELENSGQLMLIKEIFGNKYAWLKEDLKNTDNLRFMNISYKSIKELKSYNVDLLSIFIRPQSEEKVKQMLKSRNISDAEYEKRLQDYYISEDFIKKSSQDFDLVFINNYNSQSSEQLLNYINNFFHLSENQANLEIDAQLQKLLSEDISLDRKISIANELLLSNNLETEAAINE